MMPQQALNGVEMGDVIAGLRFTERDHRGEKRREAFVQRGYGDARRAMVFLPSPDGLQPKDDVFYTAEVTGFLYRSEDGNFRVIEVQVIKEIARRGEVVTLRYRRRSKPRGNGVQWESFQSGDGVDRVYVVDEREGLTPSNGDTRWIGTTNFLLHAYDNGSRIIMTVVITREDVSERAKRRRLSGKSSGVSF